MTQKIFENYQLREFGEVCLCGTKYRIEKEPVNGNILELLCLSCGRKKKIFDLLNYEKGN